MKKAAEEPAALSTHTPSHLAKSEFDYKILDFEWSIIRFYESFARFVSEVGALVVDCDLTPAEHFILHIVRLQDRPKSGATIAHLMNRDDLPNIQYSLRKLEATGLIQKHSGKSKRQPNYVVTEKGYKATDLYYQIKSRILVNKIMNIKDSAYKFELMASTLPILTGIYDEVARESAMIEPTRMHAGEDGSAEAMES